MTMFNPPHPGGIIAESLEDLELSINTTARALGVAPSTYSSNQLSTMSPGTRSNSLRLLVTNINPVLLA